MRMIVRSSIIRLFDGRELSLGLVLIEMQGHYDRTSTGEMIMKKLFAVAILGVTLCLTGLVISGEAQAQRFVDNGNGTVTDTQTGLMWTKNANPIGKRNWYDAMAGCNAFSISGIGGWRLPSKDELVALYHAMQGGHPFTGVQSSYYWSSTSCANSADCAWSVCMFGGFAQASVKTDVYHVWPVRSGQ
ncbi:MAG TPA: DUF1566 domain-containing protein [Desulfonatronum sp.]|nr:DUF1566 domain-containing protein [Desulfonatronum sp.]